MKKFLIFLVVLAAVAGGAYYWWQANAQRIIGDEVRRIAAGFFANPENLDVKTEKLRLTTLHSARVGQLVITGANLKLRKGGTLAQAKLVFTDLDVSGPPFHLSGVGGGYYQATMTDDAVTEYLHQRKLRIGGGLMQIPLDTLTVTFTRREGAVIKGQVSALGRAVPLSARGPLVESSKGNQIDLRIEKVTAGKRFSLGIQPIMDALDVLNPVVDLSEWPLQSDITTIKTDNGKVTVSGKITGVRQGFLP